MKGETPGMDASFSKERNDTYLLDPENAAEMARLEIQGQLLTRGMGGPLPELDNRLPRESQRILDLACGPGEWVRHVAKDYPQAEVIGVDISQIMVAYAQTKAQQMGLSNARFQSGNILERLEFPDGAFDLINARFLVSVLHTERWPEFARECVRLTRPGGRIRLTECDNPGQTNKAACQRFAAWSVEVCHRGNYGLARTPDSLLITPMLESLLREAGCTEVQQQAHILDFSFGTDLFESQCQNYRVAYKQAQPLFVQMGVATQEEVQATYEEMLTEITSEDFQGTWSFLTTIGHRPFSH